MSCPMHKRRSRAAGPPVRVRHEPPTEAEAAAAAQALTPDLEQQVEITAGLMGLSPDEVRPFVMHAPPLTLWPAARQRDRVGVESARRSAGPVVVVERRSPRAADDLRSVRPQV